MMRALPAYMRHLGRMKQSIRIIRDIVIMHQTIKPIDALLYRALW